MAAPARSFLRAVGARCGNSASAKCRITMIRNINLAADAGIEASKLKAGDLTARNVANLAADADVAGIPVLFRHELAATGATTTNTDLTTTYKIRIIDAWILKTEAAAANNDANTVQLLNGSTAISDAVSIRNKGDKTITRIAELDDAQATVSAGRTLRVAQVLANASDNNACEVYILAVRVA